MLCFKYAGKWAVDAAQSTAIFPVKPTHKEDASWSFPPRSFYFTFWS